ncbi:AraC family transcriptional regulator [Aestuariicella hydrocarbonica]|uniref:AraC family transcriptional regulator n=1 Tax=Pseudomaricurvus hydrocarbonicus TaxID=1470433 RepID=A0A9E5JTA8_9GAMM|nr:AraC family transcriptional regulator [Aestuariicella hydrocarbonica]NHO64151.1 AraC family transcriptional regulator [Aestuariicella hydrocarbonica]
MDTTHTASDSGLEVSVSITQTLVQALRQSGIEHTDGLLLKAGIDPSQLQRPENRIDFACQERLWQLAMEATRDDSFPLTFARQSQPASFNLAGYIAMNSRTIGDAIDAMEVYQRSAGEGGVFTISRHGQHIAIEYQPVNPEAAISTVRSCALLAANLMLGRWLVGPAYTPNTVELCLPKPARPENFTDFFQCPVQFGQAKNVIRFPRALESIAIPHASLELLSLMQQRAEKIIQARNPGNTLTLKVASLIATSLQGQEPDRASVAEKLGISQRTLQRRLASEQTSYQEVLDQTRNDLALDYLRQPQLTITDIAYLLGFTEPSAFYRAFKKWQGITPGQYRDKQ